MVNIRNNIRLQDIPIVEPPEVYIYIMLNESGKVKVGKSRNPYMRYQSLQGSNGQGISITKVWVSKATYLHSLETIMHNKMEKFRINGTEWFYSNDHPDGERLFSSAVNVLSRLMDSADYDKSNRIRMQYELNHIKEVN